MSYLTEQRQKLYKIELNVHDSHFGITYVVANNTLLAEEKLAAFLKTKSRGGMTIKSIELIARVQKADARHELLI